MSGTDGQTFEQTNAQKTYAENVELKEQLAKKKRPIIGGGFIFCVVVGILCYAAVRCYTLSRNPVIIPVPIMPDVVLKENFETGVVAGARSYAILLSQGAKAQALTVQQIISVAHKIRGKEFVIPKPAQKKGKPAKKEQTQAEAKAQAPGK